MSCRFPRRPAMSLVRRRNASLLQHRAAACKFGNIPGRLRIGSDMLLQSTMFDLLNEGCRSHLFFRNYPRLATAWAGVGKWSSCSTGQQHDSAISLQGMYCFDWLDDGCKSIDSIVS